LVFWGGAILIGLIASLFALISEFADHQFQQLIAVSAYIPLLLTPLGLMFIAYLTRRFFSGAQGSGIPQTIAAISMAESHLRDKVLSFRIAIGKVLLPFLGLLCGASIGREGPTVHIGASIMYALGRFAHFPRMDMERGLILAGGAAGIAAAFNTPLAGIVFAIEEMSRSFEERVNGTLLTAVIFAGITSLAILGNYHYFGSSSAAFSQLSDWFIVPICGVVGGLLGGSVAAMLIAGSRKIAPLIQRYPYRVAASCGIVVALCGLISGGHSYGTGYIEASQIINEQADMGAWYPFMKILATMASYFSGIPGGIFAPSLAAGAGLGADLASLLSFAPANVVILLGMVAYFCGVVQTPITAFVIIMEMTNNQDILLPLMATAFIASNTSKLICHEPIYRAMATAFLHKQ